MKKYIFLGCLLMLGVHEALAQFGDILEQVVTDKVKKETGLSEWTFKSCKLASPENSRMPSSNEMTHYMTYQHTQGQWSVHAQCTDGKYELKAASYKDAKDISDLLRAGTLKAAYQKGTFAGFYLAN